MAHSGEDRPTPALTRRASGALLGLGLVVAAALAVACHSMTPPRYHPARDLELHATYETFQRTGVPLVKPHGSGSWYTQMTDPPRQIVPALWDDDPGSYLVAAYLGRALDDPAPYNSLRVAMAVLVGLPWLVLPLAVGRLFRSPTAGAAVCAAPLVGLVLRGARSLPGTDYGLTGRAAETPVYALYGLAASWLFLGLVALLLVSTTRRRWWADAAVVVGAGVAAGFGNLLRSWSGAGLALAAGVVVALGLAGMRLPKRVLVGAGAGVLALAVAVGTQRGVMRVIDARRADITGVSAGAVPDAHATWVPLYTGLGYEGYFDGYRTPNPFGVQWSDDYVLAQARAVKPDVEFNSAEFDRVVKRLYLEQVRDEPVAVARTYAKKLGDALRQNAGVVLAVLVGAAAAIAGRRRGQPGLAAKPLAVAAAVAAPSILYGLLPPVLVFPMRYYFVELTAGLGLVLAVTVAFAGEALVTAVRARAAR